MQKIYSLLFLFLIAQSIIGQDLNDLEVNQVKNFRATSNGSTITLLWDWNSDIDITGVRVYRSLTGGEPWERPSSGKTLTPGAREFIDTGGPDGFTLQPNTDYYYAIEPYLDARRGLLSTFIKIRLGDSVNGFPDNHEGPTNLTATQNGSDVTINWDWDPSGLDIQGFKLERRKDLGDWEGDSWTPNRLVSNPNARSFTDINVESGVYVYRCFAYGTKNYTFSENVVVEVSNGVTDQLTVLPSTRNVSNSSGNTTFDISANVSWTVSESVGWLSITPTSGSNNGNFTVNYDTNGTTSERTGTITVSGNGITRNITVTQEATVIDELTVSPSNRNVSISSGSTTFDVSSNVSWIVAESVGWLSVTPTSGSNNGSFTVNYDANGTGSVRTGTITLSGGGITRNVTVAQADTVINELTIFPTNRIVSNSSANTSFDVSSNVSWTVSESVSWISVAPTSGSNNQSLTVSYDSNGTTSERTGTITVSGGGISRNVTVSQAAIAINELTVSPTDRNVTNSSGNTTFDISSNVSWTVNESEGWLSVTPTSGSNNASFTVIYETNGSTNERTGTITVSGGGISRDVTVTQALSADNIDLTDLRANQPKNFNVSSSGTSVTLTWEWNSSSTVSGFKVYRSPDGLEPWTRPTGGKFFDPSARSFVDNNLQTGERYYYLVQAFLEPPGQNSLISQERQIIVGNGEPSGVLPNPKNVTAIVLNGTVNVNWEFDSSSNSIVGFKLERQDNFGAWARPDGGKIADTNVRSYTDEANLLDGIYVYRVLAYDGDQNYPFSETAAVHIGSSINYLEIAPMNQDVGSQSDSTTFEIASTIDWIVNDDADWLTLSHTNGSNNEMLSASYDENVADSARVGTISIIGAGIIKMVTVTQAQAGNQLIVSPANQDVANNADSTTFEVSSNISWSITDDADWLTVSPQNGTNNETLTASYDANSTDNERVGTISVIGEGITRTVTVKQAAVNILTVLPVNQEVGNEADSVIFDIIANVSWTISKDVDWLSFTPVSGIGDETIRVNIEENITVNQRVGTISVNGGGITRTFTVTQDLDVGVDNLESFDEVPTDYKLHNNYPNPFNPSTFIVFDIPEESTSQLKVYDLLGNEVVVLLDNEYMSTGRFRFEFNAGNLTSGVYLYVLTSQSEISERSFRAINKMILLK
jgi:uncharacterized membrane protein YeiH